MISNKSSPDRWTSLGKEEQQMHHQLTEGISSFHGSDNSIPAKQTVRFQGMPAQIEALSQTEDSRYLSQQYQASEALLLDDSYGYTQESPTQMADAEWEPESSRTSLPLKKGQQDSHELPKTKKTRRRKPKAPVDQETAQKRRREALDKNKQAAAKCRARKKIEEGQKQERLQTLKRENQMLHTVLFQMEEQLRNAKIEIARHADCDDAATVKAKTIITEIELNYQRLKAERKSIRESLGGANAESEEDETMTGSGDFEAMSGEIFGDSEEFDAIHNRAGSEEDQLMDSPGGFDDAMHSHSSKDSNSGNELQCQEGQKPISHEYPSPPFISTLSDGIGSTSSEESNSTPLFLSDKDSGTSTKNSTIFPLSGPKSPFNLMSSSNIMDVEPHIRGGSLYPNLPSPTTNHEFDFDMSSFDTSNTSSILDASFDPSLNLFDFDFTIPQQNAADQIDTPETEIGSQMDSTYESPSPNSTPGSKQSGPPWESSKARRPHLTASDRRDSALGPEVNEVQLLQNLQSKRFPGFGLGGDKRPSLLERRSHRLATE